MDTNAEIRLAEQDSAGAPYQRVARAEPRRRAHSVDEAATILGISRAHAYELVGRNELGHVRLGRRILIPVQVLDELLDVTRASSELSSNAPSESAS